MVRRTEEDVLTNGIYLSSRGDRSQTTACVCHTLHELPDIALWVVALHRAEWSRAVLASHGIHIAIKCNHGYREREIKRLSAEYTAKWLFLAHKRC